MSISPTGLEGGKTIVPSKHALTSAEGGNLVVTFWNSHTQRGFLTDFQSPTGSYRPVQSYRARSKITGSYQGSWVSTSCAVAVKGRSSSSTSSTSLIEYAGAFINLHSVNFACAGTHVILLVGNSYFNSNMKFLHTIEIVQQHLD